MRIQDRQLRAITNRLDTTTKKIDDGNVVELLVAVADRSGVSADQAKATLNKPGITRAEQFAIAKQGLSANEKRDLVEILDSSGYTFAPAAKNFLEALVGRATLSGGPAGPGGGAESGTTTTTTSGISADESGLRGHLEPGMTIEAINLSSAPSLRLHLEDTKELGRTDARGDFLLDARKILGTDSMPRLSAGDVVRVRGRRADGTTTDWIDVRVNGQDRTNASFNGLRLTLAEGSGGFVSLTHNTSRPLSEPGAKVRLTNARSGEILDVTLNKDGSIPADLKMRGKAGDDVKVAISDGRNNTDFATVAATLTVGGSSGAVDEADDPKPHKDEVDKGTGKPMYPLRRYNGPLFVDGPSSSDVRQGAIGNCYFPAACAAVAHQRPDAIEKAITESVNAAGEREFNVRFYTPSGRMEMVTVDADLYTRSWGGPIYGATTGQNTADKMELWFPILEKAWAKWKGSYDTIGNGGSPADVIRALTGKGIQYLSTGSSTPDSIFDAARRAGDDKLPATAGTFDDEKKYTNTGVYGDHAYSVLGAEEKNGTRFIILRNPWGESEAGNDGKNDGVFRLELSKFMKLYDDLSVARA